MKSASRCKTVVTKTTAVISGMILEPGVGKSEGENTTYYTKTLHIILKHYILYQNTTYYTKNNSFILKHYILY